MVTSRWFGQARQKLPQPVDTYRDHRLGLSRVAPGLLCLHVIAITPAGSGLFARTLHHQQPSLYNSQVGFPYHVFSGPAQRSLTLWSLRAGRVD